MSEELRMEVTMHLCHPLTEEQRDYLLDVDFDHTPAVYFRTKHGKEVRFVKAQLNNIWISAKAMLPDENEWVLCQCRAGIREVLRWQNGQWYHDPSHAYMDSVVTHWTPLPAPPMGGDADD